MAESRITITLDDADRTNLTQCMVEMHRQLPDGSKATISDTVRAALKFWAEHGDAPKIRLRKGVA